MAASQQKAKIAKGTRNPERRCGKAWKKGLSPGKREEIERTKRQEREARRTQESRDRREARLAWREYDAEQRRQKRTAVTVNPEDEGGPDI